MKILVVTHSSKLSGANQSLLSIIEGLNNEIEFVILVNDEEAPLIKSVKEMNIRVLIKKYSWWYAPPRNNFVKTILRYCLDAIKYYRYRNLSSSFIKKLKLEDFDLIYTNTGVVDIGADIAKKLGIPHVWHIREFGKEDFELKRLVRKKVQQQKFNDATKIVTISKALKAKFVQFVDTKNVEVVYNGFEIDNLKFKPHRLNDKVKILITGQVSQAKGQLQAVQAISSLIEKGYDLELYLAGNINPYYAKKLLDVSQGKEWLKMLNQVEDIYQLRKSIDVELICSRSEAFGRVTIEAMLHGIPVIGSSKGGTPELINNGETGYIYEYDNVISLEREVEGIITKPCDYERIAANGFEYAQKYTIKRTTDELFKILKGSIIKEKT